MINGLTRPVGSPPILASIGKIKKGTRKISGRMGNDLGKDFRPHMSTKYAHDKFVEAFGEKCPEFTVYFPFPDLRDNWDAYWEHYNSQGQLLWRGDGDKIVRQLVGKDYIDYDPLDPSSPDQPEGIGSMVGRMSVVLDGFTDPFGTVTFETHSIYDILHIEKILYDFHVINGTLQSTPFVVSRDEREISVPMKGKRGKVKKWLMNVRPKNGWGDINVPRLMEQISLGKPMEIPSAVETAVIESGAVIVEDSGYDWNSVVSQIVHDGLSTEVEVEAKILELKKVKWFDFTTSLTEEEFNAKVAYLSKLFIKEVAVELDGVVRTDG